MSNNAKSNNKQKKKPQPKSQEPEDATIDMEESQESILARFDIELTWCIEQLQLGLETQNPDSRQAKEASKLLKILLSSKAPMVKKRQVMRNSFGDYRKTMAEEEKQSAIAAKKIKLSAVDQTGDQKSVFFKKSASKLSDKLENQTTSSKTVTLKSSENDDVAFNSSFKFDFKINDPGDNKEMCENDDESAKNNKDTSGTMDSEFAAGAISMDSHSNANVGPFPFSKTDNSFKFNFHIPE